MLGLSRILVIVLEYSTSFKALRNIRSLPCPGLRKLPRQIRDGMKLIHCSIYQEPPILGSFHLRPKLSAPQADLYDKPGLGSAEPGARRAIDFSTTNPMCLACVSGARRLCNGTSSSTTYRH
jgi:hypothetical protein